MLKKAIGKIFLSVAVAGGAGFVALSASASTINWTLEGVAFTDGGTASGTFSTDSTTGFITAYNITTTPGTSLSGGLYNEVTSSVFATNFWSPNSFIVVTNTPFASPYINFAFVNPLTSAGFNLLVAAGFLNGSWECHDDTCQSPNRFVTSGAAVSATPLPAALPLFATGLGVTWLIARRKKRRVPNQS